MIEKSYHVYLKHPPKCAGQARYFLTKRCNNQVEGGQAKAIREKILYGITLGTAYRSGVQVLCMWKLHSNYRHQALLTVEAPLRTTVYKAGDLGAALVCAKSMLL